MRKVIAITARLVVLVATLALASCESGRTASSLVNDTDPNAVFAQGGAQTNSATGNPSGRSSRRGRGSTAPSDATTQSQ